MPRESRESESVRAVPRRALLTLALGGLIVAALAGCKTQTGQPASIPRKGHDGGPGGN